MHFSADDISFLPCSLRLFTEELDHEDRSVLAPTRTVEPVRKFKNQSENAPTRTFIVNEPDSSFLGSSQCLITHLHAVEKNITRSDTKSPLPRTKTVRQSENSPTRIRTFISTMTPIFPPPAFCSPPHLTADTSGVSTTNSDDLFVDMEVLPLAGPENFFPNYKPFVRNLHANESVAPHLQEFARTHGVEPESLIFMTTTMPNISVPGSVTAQDLLRKEDQYLSVLVKYRDRNRRQTTQPVAVDLG